MHRRLSSSSCVRLRCVGLLALVLAALGVLAPASAARPDGATAYAEAAQAARELEAEARYFDARARLLSVDPAGLPPEIALERRSFLARLDNRRREALERDLARAEKLGVAGDLPGARTVLGSVERYGSPDDVARAKKRLEKIEAAVADREASRAAAADEARAATAAAKKRQKAAVPLVSAAIRRWLKHRRRLLCSSCRGTKRTRCKACGGSGRRRVLGVAGGSRTEDCPRCEDGKVRCPSCRGLGLNRAKLDDLLFLPLSKAERKKLGRRRRFGKQVERALAGEETDPAAIGALVKTMRWALEPVIQTSRIEVAVESGARSARARYMAQTPGGVREERVRFVPDGKRWVIVPGPLTGAPAPD